MTTLSPTITTVAELIDHLKEYPQDSLVYDFYSEFYHPDKGRWALNPDDVSEQQEEVFDARVDEVLKDFFHKSKKAAKSTRERIEDWIARTGKNRRRRVICGAGVETMTVPLKTNAIYIQWCSAT